MYYDVRKEESGVTRGCYTVLESCFFIHVPDIPIMNILNIYL